MTETRPTITGLRPNDPHHEPSGQTVTVNVNERPVQLLKKADTGLEIKKAAIAQGVPIELDFILVEELGGDRTKTIGDGDLVHVTHKTQFLANSGDDNS